MKMTSWIEKKIPDLSSDQSFNEYFNGIELERDEDDYYLYNADKGIDLVIDKHLRVTTIHLFSGKTNDGKVFSGLIPHNLVFTMSQTAIHSAFGTPNRSGGGYTDITGPIPIWDKYYFPTYSLHLQYSSNKESIDIITFASLKLESTLNAQLQ